MPEELCSSDRGVGDQHEGILTRSWACLPLPVWQWSTPLILFAQDKTGNLLEIAHSVPAVPRTNPEPLRGGSAAALQAAWPSILFLHQSIRGLFQHNTEPVADLTLCPTGLHIDDIGTGTNLRRPIQKLRWRQALRKDGLAKEFLAH